MSIFRTLDDFDMTGKRVLLRVDMNVPIHDGVITDTTRIERTIPTLREVLAKGAGIILCSHLGRPEGRVIEKFSLEPLMQILRSFLPNININFSPDGELVAQPGEIVLLENLRFNPGEESNTSAFARFLSELGDIYINDAFSCSHRAHASIDGVAHLMPSGAGRLMQQELEALDHALNHSEHPVAAVVGGNKISTKLGVLENLIRKVDHLIVGGAMANTFLYAKGINIGNSLCEKNLSETALLILLHAKKFNCEIILPIDVVCANNLNDKLHINKCDVKNIPSNQMVLDLGSKTIKLISKYISKSDMILWNGPLGAFEHKPFENSSIEIANFIKDRFSNSTTQVIAGGGDTISAIKLAHAEEGFTYISNAGGAFLEWLEGKKSPGVSALEKNQI